MGTILAKKHILELISARQIMGPVAEFHSFNDLLSEYLLNLHMVQHDK